MFSGAAFTHLPQPMHAALHAFIFRKPFWGFEQWTWIGADLGTSRMSFFGQVCTHLPQPLHNSLWTTAM